LIATAEGDVHGIIYPRHIAQIERRGGTKSAMEDVEHPSKNQIVATIKRALQEAKSELNQLGVLVNAADRECFKYDPRLAVTSISSELEKIASPLVDDCDEPDIERVDEIDDQ
jgi:hypothetical protein